MAKTFQLNCPECGTQYQLDVAMIGAKVKCTGCGVKFIAHEQAPQEAVPVAAAAAAAAAATERATAEVRRPAAKPSTQLPAQEAEAPVADAVVKPAEEGEAVSPVAKASPPKTESKPAQKSNNDSAATANADPSPKPARAPKAKKKQPTRQEKSAPKTQAQPQEKPKQQPTSTAPDPKHFAAVDNIAQVYKKILDEVGKVIVGQRDVIDQVLTAFFARGNCLLKGVPGLAKTLLVNTLADSMALQFHRIQFTPDLMPTDITGTNILEEDPSTGKRIFTFRKGPVFTNLLLADEINRTPPKTQAALLEAMQEKQVTSGEKLYRLPDPFLVLATQNPIEQEGTYTLPEAQLDRFIFMVNVGYPTEEEEMKILLDTTRDQQEQVRHVLDAEGILKIQEIVRSIPVTEHVASYASRLVRATRPEDPTAPDFIKNWLHFGCGPRAGQSLLLAAKAHAALHGRTVVACDDIRAYALPTLRHRLVLNFAAAAEGLTPDDVIKKLLDHVKEKTS